MKKKIKKVIKIVFIVIVIIIAVVGIGVLGTNLYVRLSVKDRILKLDEAKELEDVDCILVLGASVQNNEKPSLMLQDRLDRGIELYFAGCAPKLLMSGDHGSMYYNEVAVMKSYAEFLRRIYLWIMQAFQPMRACTGQKIFLRLKKLLLSHRSIICTVPFMLRKSLDLMYMV